MHFVSVGPAIAFSNGKTNIVQATLRFYLDYILVVVIDVSVFLVIWDVVRIGNISQTA